MEIGSKIKELRMKNGLTQEELADRSELSKGFISQLENDVTCLLYTSRSCLRSTAKKPAMKRTGTI